MLCRTSVDMWATGGGGGHSGILTGEQRLLPVFLTRPCNNAKLHLAAAAAAATAGNNAHKTKSRHGKVTMNCKCFGFSRKKTKFVNDFSQIISATIKNQSVEFNYQEFIGFS